MLLLVWFNWDMSKSSNKFSVQVIDDSEQSTNDTKVCEEADDTVLSETELTFPSAKAEIHGNGRIATTARVLDGSGFKTVVGD